MMIEYLVLLVGVFRAVLCSRTDLVAENLLLRQQLTVLTRPTQRRSRLRSRDKLFWLVIRTLRRAWRQHLVLVRPDTSSGGSAKGGRCSGAGTPTAGSAVRG